MSLSPSIAMHSSVGPPIVKDFVVEIRSYFKLMSYRHPSFGNGKYKNLLPAKGFRIDHINIPYLRYDLVEEKLCSVYTQSLTLDWNSNRLLLHICNTELCRLPEDSLARTCNFNYLYILSAHSLQASSYSAYTQSNVTQNLRRFLNSNGRTAAFRKQWREFFSARSNDALESITTSRLTSVLNGY